MIQLNLNLMIGAKNILISNYEKYYMVLATSSSQDTAYDVLKKVNILHYFDYILTREDVIFPKPSPEIFLKCSKLTNVSADECLVFEDSKKGLLSALNANMKVVIIPNKYTINEDFHNATFIFDSLDKVTHTIINGL